MARLARSLTARQVTTAKPGVYGDGNGLFLVVKDSGARSWEVRYALPRQKRRSIGLGAVDKPHSLAEAREQARLIQKQAKGGTDPLSERTAQAAKLKADRVTFQFCVEAKIESLRPTWRSDKYAHDWRSSLDRHAGPRLNAMPVQDITLTDVLAVLQPIWLKTPVTANRVRNRIEMVLDWAINMDYRTSGDNPARWGGKLRGILPSPTKVAETERLLAGRAEHLAALPWQEMPAFMEALRSRQFVGARALEFVILTSVRSREGSGARWEEIDFENRIWTVPAIRMKMGKVHVVPLSTAAMAVLMVQQEQDKYFRSQFVFPGDDPHRPIGSSTMISMLKSLHDGVTVHGFRSTFRQWAAETERSDAAAEMALAHTLGKVERAYQRSIRLESRRELAEAWANYIAGTTTVVPLRAVG